MAGKLEELKYACDAAMGSGDAELSGVGAARLKLVVGPLWKRFRSGERTLVLFNSIKDLK